MLFVERGRDAATVSAKQQVCWNGPKFMARPALIKRYANRRLYNTSTCTYVTRDDLARMVKRGEDFVVTDGKTSEDITGLVLRQIIIEHESRENQSLLPITFLLQLIRFYGDSMRMLVPPYLELSIDSFTREQEKLRRHMSQAFSDSPFAMLEGLRGETWKFSSGPSRRSRCSRSATPTSRQAQATTPSAHGNEVRLIASVRPTESDRATKTKAKTPARAILAEALGLPPGFGSPPTENHGRAGTHVRQIQGRTILAQI
jgi:polyhydroxyalkanoate synthesis repressor PhaR